MWFKKKAKKITLVCFDLDNTLADYGLAESETEVYLAELLSLDTHKKKTPREILTVFNTVKHSHMHHDSDPKKFSRALWIKETLQQLKLRSEKKPHDYEKQYWEFFDSGFRLFPRAKETLHYLKKQGYTLALLSDSDGRTAIKIERIKILGVYELFDYIITTDETGVNKPNIKNWEYLLEKSGCNTTQCVMIGDHPDMDLLNPKKLGFKTIWSKEHLKSDMHYQYVDAEVTEISQVITIIKNWS